MKLILMTFRTIYHRWMIVTMKTVPGTLQQKKSTVKKSLFTSGIEKESKGKAEKRKMKRATPAKDTVTQEPRKKNTKRK